MGCCPLYLLQPARVRIDGTSPHLPPLTERMDEERSPINRHGISPMRGMQKKIHNLATLHTVPFSSSSSCLVSSELTQASECLRLTAARGSDFSLSPSVSGSWRSAFPILRSSPRSHLNLSRCRFYRLQFGAVCGNPEQKACKRHASENQKRRRTLQGQSFVLTASTGAESSTSTPSAEEVRGEVSHGPDTVTI